MKRLEKICLQERNRFVDELQAHIVLAGGRKIRTKELKEMTLDSILKFVYPNAIRFNIYALMTKDVNDDTL